MVQVKASAEKEIKDMVASPRTASSSTVEKISSKIIKAYAVALKNLETR